MCIISTRHSTDCAKVIRQNSERLTVSFICLSRDFVILDESIDISWA